MNAGTATLTSRSLTPPQAFAAAVYCTRRLSLETAPSWGYDADRQILITGGERRIQQAMVAGRGDGPSISWAAVPLVF
jgi:hypothetical protein